MVLYNGFYGLTQNPFRLTADPGFFYVTAQHREALAGLVYSVRNHSGLAVLTGEAGTGKTTILQVLRRWLDERRFVIAVLTNPTLSREEFYDLVLEQMAVQCESALKSRQLVALEQAVTVYRKQDRRPLLIIDEAHRLTPTLLEEVRLLLNMETPDDKLIDIILAGQPELADLLRRPELRQFKQRVSCFCHLEPLTSSETVEYIQHRLSRAGASGPLFAPDAVEAIHTYTNGIPRLINSLCDSALRIAFALSAPTVTAAIANEAAADLDLCERTEAAARPSSPAEDYASRQASLDALADFWE